jgi:hypothetical protein
MQLDLMSPVEYRGNADIDTRVIGFYRMLRDIVERQCANNVPYRHPSVEVRDIDGRLLHFLEAIEETPSMTTDTEKAWTLYTVFTASHFVDYFSPFYANGRPENVVYPCKCEPHRCVILSPILSLSLSHPISSSVPLGFFRPTPTVRTRTPTTSWWPPPASTGRAWPV